MVTYFLLAYLLGFIVMLFAGPKIAPWNEDEDRPILSATYLIMAAAWPIMVCYLTASVLFGDDDDDSQMG